MLCEGLYVQCTADSISETKATQIQSGLLRLQSTKNHQTDPQTYPENRKWVLTEAESGYVMEIRVSKDNKV